MSDDDVALEHKAVDRANERLIAELSQESDMQPQDIICAVRSLIAASYQAGCADLAAVTRERDAAMAVVEAAHKARICLAARGIAARREARTVLVKALAAHDATTAPTPDQGEAE